MNIFCNLRQAKYQGHGRVNAGFRLAGSQCHICLQEHCMWPTSLLFPSLGLLIFKMGRRRIPLQCGCCEMECMSTQVLSPDLGTNQILSQPYVKCWCDCMLWLKKKKGSTGEKSSPNISYWLHHYFLEIEVEFSAFRWKWN